MFNKNCLLIILAFITAQQPVRNYAACVSNTVMLASSNSHFGMVHRIEAALYAQPNVDSKPTHITVENIPSPAFLELLDKSCLIVTIGTEALDKILKINTSVPVLSVLSRKKPFETLLKQNSKHMNDDLHPMSVIYLDQPEARQLNLAKCLLPSTTSNNTIGVLLDSNSAAEQITLQKLAKKKNLKLVTVHVSAFENPVAVLDGLLDDVDMVLALPNNQIYNSITTRGMLISAFHKHLPIIGYSKAYVKHGALAAVYSTTKQLADQTANQVIAFLASKEKKLSPPQYPQEFVVAINYQVAHTLGLEIGSETAVKQTMDTMENHKQ